MKQSKYSMADLQRVMQRLRDPVTGCPWDKAQDFKSVISSTLEECYELAQSIEDEDYPHVAEELGDVLFQVMFYSQMGDERNLFHFEDVVDTLVAKLLRRHPHVFLNNEIEGVVDQSVSVEEVNDRWEAIKQDERKARAESEILADVPLALPALSRAQKLQKRATGVGFDWAEPGAVLDKLREEIEELEQAMAAREQAAIEDEMGDVLFTCVNMARQLGLDAESSLRRATRKFEKRFVQMEILAEANGESVDGMSGEELEALWKKAKSCLKLGT
ncbi:MAG: nucleoside triphosphate pyrophosphohydrolase [Halieaceae bacterium]|jgi:nucleoside triphosphate diphosphatase|nr:nucleoside triphosphate pyrophosphohydrolase [Halieaceae bacterium]